MSLLSKMWNDLTGKTERRRAQEIADQQIAEFHQQEAEFRQEKEKLEAEREQQKKLVEKKQIRSLRRQRTARGFLEEPAQEPKGTLS